MALEHFENSELFDEREIAALAYTDAMTLSDADVTDGIFSELQKHFDDNQIVELTETIAWENASSKFNHALRIPSQNLWVKKKPID